MKQGPLALTCGEPASIAPEITAMAWAALRHEPQFNFVLIGDTRDVKARCEIAGLSIPIIGIATAAKAPDVFASALPVLDMPMAVASRPSWIDTRNSAQVINAIKLATGLCLEGICSGMVTNPIHKDALYAVGFKHQGHTDYLAHLASGEERPIKEVMMLVAGDLRTVPITVHVSLSQVPQVLKTDDIVTQGQVTALGLQRWFGIEHPRLWVTGLNPHAGENGAMGGEEKTIIEPAIHRLRALGLDVTGPVSADTAFHTEARSKYDAILCMYHDQALIPVKTLDFHGGVNVTLGLPFIRTSPDHGTALSLAGTGTARPDSLIAAIRLAAQLATRKT